MKPIRLTQQVRAAPAAVFAAASDFAGMSKRIPGIVRVEMLTSGAPGRGTRFKETRIMFGKEATEEMTVAEFDPPHSYVLTAGSCGAIFRSEMKFVPDAGGTRIEQTTTCEAVSFWAKLFSPLSAIMMGSMTKLMQADLAQLALSLEQNPGTGVSS